MAKLPIGATDREMMTTTDEVSGRIVAIGEDYADPSRVSVSVELPMTQPRGGGAMVHPSRSAVIGKKAAAAFAIGDEVTIITRIERRR